MAIFYRAVRNLVDFSLVTKLTKHVSKVRETVRKRGKIRQNDCETFFMTSDSQKMTSRFLDSNFCTKFQISQPGWYPDQAIKILHMENFYRPVSEPAWSRNLELCSKIGIQKSRRYCLHVWHHDYMRMHSSHIFFALSYHFSHFWHVFCTSRDQAEINWAPYHPKKIRHMENFYRAVRNLVDFSLVTKLTKHESKVRETVRKCEKIRQNNCKTIFYDVRLAKNDIAIFWIPIFVQNSGFHNQAGTLTGQ